LNKYERKLIKLQSKAQDCISREQAQKILKKHRKKITKMSEAISRVDTDEKPPSGAGKCGETHATHSVNKN